MYFTVDNIYSDIVFWRRNLFVLLSGVAEKRFINEATKWIEYWNNDSIHFKDIAFKVVIDGYACSASTVTNI